MCVCVDRCVWMGLCVCVCVCVYECALQHSLKDMRVQSVSLWGWSSISPPPYVPPGQTKSTDSVWTAVGGECVSVDTVPPTYQLFLVVRETTSPHPTDVE